MHELLTFSHNCSPAFTKNGFNNWKKAVEKFNAHEASHTHQEKIMKRLALGQPKLSEIFNMQTRRVQEGRRKALLTQISCLRYLLWQGLAIRGHNDDQQGNLKQLLVMMAADSNPFPPEMGKWWVWSKWRPCRPCLFTKHYCRYHNAGAQGSPYPMWFVSLSLQRTGLWWGLNHARHTERCCNSNTEWKSCCSSCALLCPFLKSLLIRCWKTNPSIKRCTRYRQRNWQTD